MSILFQHKKYTPPPKEEEVITKTIKMASRQVRNVRDEVESFKMLGLSFIIDDFHRPDGKIVERTVPTTLETYTDRINGEEYETGNVEDLDYIDKFKIKFLFPIQAYREFEDIKPKTIWDMVDFKNPTILPVTEKEIEEEGEAFIEYLGNQAKKPKIIHLEDIDHTSKAKICNILFCRRDFFSENSFSKGIEVLFDELIKELMSTESNLKK